LKLLGNKIVLLVLGLLVGGGAALGGTIAMGGSLPFLPAKEETVAVQPARRGVAVAAPAPRVEVHEEGIMYPIRERVVNLSDTGMLRYLKSTIVLELFDSTIKGPMPKGEEYKKKQDEMVKEMRAQNPIIDDQITAILSAKQASDLMTLDGKGKLKEEIKSRLNKALGEEKVIAVYFTDFIIQ
jgi:flagellar FliL protein